MHLEIISSIHAELVIFHIITFLSYVLHYTKLPSIKPVLFCTYLMIITQGNANIMKYEP